MEQELQNRLDAQDAKLQAIYESVEKTRQYFLWILVGTAVMFVLPLIGLLFVIPTFLSLYTGMGELGL